MLSVRDAPHGGEMDVKEENHGCGGAVICYECSRCFCIVGVCAAVFVLPYLPV